jgi:hypothetical protein
MKRNTIFLTILSIMTIILAASCRSGGATYGEELTLEQTTSLAALFADPRAYSGQEVLVSGRIIRVCQEMGCWLALDAGNEEELIVRFKDYAFFVPKDLAGKTARVQGIFTAEVDESHLHEHDEEETHECPIGKFAFTASGVEVI